MASKKELEEENAYLRSENQKLSELIREEAIPNLTKATEKVRDARSTIEKMIEDMRELNTRLDK